MTGQGSIKRLRCTCVGEHERHTGPRGSLNGFEWLCICYEYIRTERERKTDPEKNRYQDFGRSISGISRSRERRGNGITKGMVKIPCADGTLHGSLWVPGVGGADRYNVLQVIESMKCSHSSASVEHFT